MTSTHVVQGLKATLLSHGVRVVAKGALVLALTREFLTSGEYGLLFFTISVLSVALMLVDLGTAKSGARYLSEYLERDTSQIPYILSSVLKYRVLSILVVGSLFVAFGDTFARLLGEPASAPLLTVGIAFLAARSLKSYALVMCQGFNRVVWSAVISTTASVGEFVFVIGFLLVGLGTYGAFLGYITGSAVAALLGLAILYTRFYTKYESAETVEPGLPSSIRRYSLPLIAARGANVLDKRVDTILLGVLVNPVAVGYYTLGKQVSDFVMAPAASLGFTVAPTYGQRKERGELGNAARVYETTFEYMLLLYVPAAVGMALLAEPAVSLLFGSGYLGAIPVVQVFSVFVLMQALAKITTDGLDYLGRSRARAVVNWVSAGSNFALNLVLIPPFGAVGAAVATVVTYFLMVVVDIYVINQELSIQFGRLLWSLARVTGVSAAMGVAILFLRPYITNVVWLFAVVLLGVTLWAAMSLLAGLLDVEQLSSMFGTSGN